MCWEEVCGMCQLILQPIWAWGRGCRVTAFHLTLISLSSAMPLIPELCYFQMQTSFALLHSADLKIGSCCGCPEFLSSLGPMPRLTHGLPWKVEPKWLYDWVFKKQMYHEQVKKERERKKIRAWNLKSKGRFQGFQPAAWEVRKRVFLSCCYSALILSAGECQGFFQCLFSSPFLSLFSAEIENVLDSCGICFS